MCVAVRRRHFESPAIESFMGSIAAAVLEGEHGIVRYEPSYGHLHALDGENTENKGARLYAILPLAPITASCKPGSA